MTILFFRYIDIDIFSYLNLMKSYHYVNPTGHTNFLFRILMEFICAR